MSKVIVVIPPITSWITAKITRALFDLSLPVSKS